VREFALLRTQIFRRTAYATASTKKSRRIPLLREATDLSLSLSLRTPPVTAIARVDGHGQRLAGSGHVVASWIPQTREFSLLCLCIGLALVARAVASRLIPDIHASTVGAVE
jgi:hypothetical protein